MYAEHGCQDWGVGRDAKTPAVDTTNETTGLPGENDIDGIQYIPGAFNTFGKTIGDHLVTWGHSYKNYQKSLPLAAANNVTHAATSYPTSTDSTQIFPPLKRPRP